MSQHWQSPLQIYTYQMELQRQFKKGTSVKHKTTIYTVQCTVLYNKYNAILFLCLALLGSPDLQAVPREQQGQNWWCHFQITQLRVPHSCIQNLKALLDAHSYLPDQFLPWSFYSPDSCGSWICYVPYDQPPQACTSEMDTLHYPTSMEHKTE